MGKRMRLVAGLAVAAATVTAPSTGTVTAAASLQLTVTATSTPTFWLEDRTYEVLLTNDGDEPVSDVTGQVSSPELPAVALALGTPTPVAGNADDLLEPGEQWRYDVIVPTASEWGFAAEGTASGGSIDAFARSERERYPSAFAFPVSIEIEHEPGPYAQGTEIPFTVTATNESSVPLTIDCEHALDDAALTIDPVPIGPPAAAGNGDDVVDPGEVWTWMLTHPIVLSGSVLHVLCDVDRADLWTGGLRLYETSGLIALPRPAASIEIEATPGSTPTMWLEDRSYDLLVTNTGDESLDFLSIEVTSVDATAAGGAAITGPTEITGDGDDRFDPGEQVQFTAVVPTLASWLFRAAALTPGGFDVTDEVAGERNVPGGTYADPVLVEVAAVEGSQIVVGEPTTVTLTNIAEFDLDVTVDAPWGRTDGPAVSSLAPGASASWVLAAPSQPRIAYVYERDVVGFALAGSVNLALVITDPPPPTAPVGTLPATGGGATALLALAMLTTAGGGALLMASARRNRRRPLVVTSTGRTTSPLPRR